MKLSKNWKSAVSMIAISAGLAFTSACSLIKDQSSIKSAAHHQGVAPSNDGAVGDAFDSESYSGTGSTMAPTREAQVDRIVMALENRVNPLSGSFSQSLSRVGSNLNGSSHPVGASGADAFSTVAYGACSDLNSSAVGVNENGTLATQRPLIVAFGVRVATNLYGDLVTGGPKVQLEAALNELIDQNAAIAGTTVRQHLRHVCMAVLNAGVIMKGV